VRTGDRDRARHGHAVAFSRRPGPKPHPPGNSRLQVAAAIASTGAQTWALMAGGPAEPRICHADPLACRNRHRVDTAAGSAAIASTPMGSRRRASPAGAHRIWTYRLRSPRVRRSHARQGSAAAARRAHDRRHATARLGRRSHATALSASRRCNAGERKAFSSCSAPRLSFARGGCRRCSRHRHRSPSG
jgi:hypothetical protein